MKIKKKKKTLEKEGSSTPQKRKKVNENRYSNR